MNKPSVLNILAFAIPMVCLVVAASVIYFQVRRIGLLADERKRVEKDIAIVENTIKRIDSAPPPPHIPTAEMSPREQLGFLNALRAYADASRVQLVRWTEATPVAPTNPNQSQNQNPEAGQNPGDPAQNRYPAGVIPIASAIEVSGEYNRLREFMYYLLRSPRLFSMSDVKWGRGYRYPRTSVSFTLTRYVSLANRPAPTLNTTAIPPPGSANLPAGTGSGGTGTQAAPSAPPAPVVSNTTGAGR